MKSNQIDESKTKYFVIAIILLVVLGVILVIHFNNKSLVNGEEDIKTTTSTTTTTTTTKKKRVNKNKEEVKEETVVYKSVIDESNKLVYNYKLTDEIIETDSIISEKLEVKEELKNNNVIALFDISLYDANKIKKSVINSLIEISIPLTEDLIGYDEYRVIYIDEEGKITDEKFDIVIENDYIKFSTTHLSLYAIVGIKNEVVEEVVPEVEPEIEEIIPEEEKKDEVEEEVKPDDEKEEVKEEEIADLTKITIDFIVNGEKSEKTNIYLEKDDEIEVKVNGISEDYKLYYLLKDETEAGTYKEFDDNLLSTIEVSKKYKLSFKIVVGEDESLPIEIGTIRVYDIVYNYDKDVKVEKNEVIGEIKDEDGNESDYTKFDENKNIVIDNVEKTEEVLPEDDKQETETLPEVDNVDSEETTTPDDNTTTEEPIVPDDENLLPGDEETTTNPDDDIVELPSDKATISLKGNVYIVEKTDISNLEIKGYLVIDTNEDIIFDTIDNTSVYSVIIKSKEFSINGVKYTYEIKDEKIVITKLVQVEENEELVEKSEEVTKEDFESIFDGYHYDETKEELELTPLEDVVEDSQPDNVQPDNSLEPDNNIQPEVNEEIAETTLK